MNLSSNLILTWGLGEVGTLVDTIVSFGRLQSEQLWERLLPCPSKPAWPWLPPKAIGTLAPIAGADVCVIFAFEEDCNDCDDIEELVLADLGILFKVLPLHKCMHKDVDFP